MADATSSTIRNVAEWLGEARRAVVFTGAGMPHNNLQPYLTFYFNIALQGVFPPRT